jgi:hypothetical protein
MDFGCGTVTVRFMKWKCKRCNWEFESGEQTVCPICKDIRTDRIDPEPTPLSQIDRDQIAKGTAELLGKNIRLSPNDLKEIGKSSAEELANNLPFRIRVSLWMTLFVGTIFGFGILGALLQIWKETKARIEYVRNDITNLVGQTHLEISSNIVRQFEEPRIRVVVLQVASNEARNILISQIHPEVERFEKQISEKVDQINAVATNAVLTVKRLEEQSQFLSVMTSALSGSRSNFMVLVKWSKDNVFVFNKEARDSVDSAIVLNGYNPMGTRFVLEWADGVDPSKIPYEGLEHHYWNLALSLKSLF